MKDLERVPWWEVEREIGRRLEKGGGGGERGKDNKDYR